MGGIINVKDFGARGDGRTDDTKAIQAAINASPAAAISPGTIYFPAGTYLLSSFTLTNNYLENYFLLVQSKLTFKGEGNRSVIKIGNSLFNKKDTSANAHLFYGVYVDNIVFKDLLIDMNGAQNLTPENTIKNHCAIFIKHGNGVTISNTTIKNCAGNNMVIIIGSGKNVLIEKSNFINGGYYVGSTKPNQYKDDFSFLYCEWDSARVIKNNIEQQNIDIALNCFTGGIELHGSYSLAAGNRIVGCNPGIYISSSWHPMEKTVVLDNVMENCLRGITFWLSFPMNNITIQDNKISLTKSRALKLYILSGIEVPNGNTEIYDSKHANGATINHLTVTGNYISATLDETATDRTAGMVLHSLHNSIICNNKISGMNFGGMILQGSKWGIYSLIISRNSFLNFKGNIDTISPAGYITITDHYSPKNKLAIGIKDVEIKDNKLIAVSNTGSPANKTFKVKNKRGEFFNVFIAGPPAIEKKILLSNNNFASKKEDTRVVRITN